MNVIAYVKRVRSGQRRSVREQDGAYVIEYLGTLIALMAFILLVVQVVLIFMNAILVNHAIGLAATEASARGGVDDSVAEQFRRHLPKELKDEQYDVYGGLQSTAKVGGVITPGFEPTTSGQMITLKYEYDQDFHLLKLLGLDTSMHMQRTLKVSSQSAKE